MLLSRKGHDLLHSGYNYQELSDLQIIFLLNICENLHV